MNFLFFGLRASHLQKQLCFFASILSITRKNEHQPEFLEFFSCTRTLPPHQSLSKPCLGNYVVDQLMKRQLTGFFVGEFFILSCVIGPLTNTSFCYFFELILVFHHAQRSFVIKYKLLLLP